METDAVKCWPTDANAWWARTRGQTPETNVASTRANAGWQIRSGGKRLVGSPDEGRAIDVGVPPYRHPGREGEAGGLRDLSDNMTGKSICVLSDSCAAPAVIEIQKFRGEFEAYIAGAREPALVAV